MGREQGDHLGEIEAVTYVGTVNGVEYERVATTPAEHVNLRARGWVTAASLGREESAEAKSYGTATSPSSSSDSSTPTTTSTATSTSEGQQNPSDFTTGQPTGGSEATAARRAGKRAPDVAGAAPQDGAAAGTE